MSKYQLKEFVYYGKLFSCSGKLLSKDRQELMSAYFEYNMTLAEIAKEKGVSRQAILDGIEKACDKLDNFETNLHLLEKKELFAEELQKIQEQTKEEEIREKVVQLLEKL